MFDGFSWAAMGVMIALIAVIVTIAGFWMNAALDRTELRISTKLGKKITELSKKSDELEASTAQRFTELEAHTDNKLGEIRIDLSQINVRLKQLEHQVAPVFEQLVEAGLVNIPAAGGRMAPAPRPAAGWGKDCGSSPQ